MKSLALILLFALSGITYAGEPSILVDHIPLGAEQAQVLAIVKQAFIGRRWKIDSEDASSVTGTIWRRTGGDAHMQISVLDGKLIYTGDMIVKDLTNHSPVNAPSLLAHRVPIAGRWVANLKRDISLALAAIPDHR